MALAQKFVSMDFTHKAYALFPAKLHHFSLFMCSLVCSTFIPHYAALLHSKCCRVPVPNWNCFRLAMEQNCLILGGKYIKLRCTFHFTIHRDHALKTRSKVPSTLTRTVQNYAFGARTINFVALLLRFCRSRVLATKGTVWIEHVEIFMTKTSTN